MTAYYYRMRSSGTKRPMGSRKASPAWCKTLGRSKQTGVLRKCCASLCSSFYMSALEFTNNYAHEPAQRSSSSKVAILLRNMLGNRTVSTNAISRRATTVRRIPHGIRPRGRIASRFLGRPKFVSCMIIIIEDEQFECSRVPSKPYFSCPQVVCWFYFPYRTALLEPSSTAPLIL